MITLYQLEKVCYNKKRSAQMPGFDPSRASAFALVWRRFSLTKDLTQGGITKTLVQFSLPMIAGNLLQQLYNIADTLIVGRFLGA